MCSTETKVSVVVNVTRNIYFKVYLRIWMHEHYVAFINFNRSKTARVKKTTKHEPCQDNPLSKRQSPVCPKKLLLFQKCLVVYL